ncbi:hypothetical protein EXIGLDRAFT_782961, partial [Exidia glandulosa HHB12029]
FNYGVRQQVSDTVSRLRGHCWEIFGSEFADHLRDPDERFAHFARRIGYQPATSTAGPCYSRIDCPFLHSSECETFDLDDVYTHDHLWLIFVAITRGPEAARQARISNGETKYTPPNPTKGEDLEITHTTAGAIAACVTFAKYTFSRDTELRAKGAATSINYKTEFDEHLAELLELQRDEVPHIMKLFEDWNYKVFGTKETHDRTHPVTAEERAKEERQRVRAQIRAKLNALRRSGQQGGGGSNAAGLGEEELREQQDDRDANDDE